ncbi:conserved hypothetical protein [Pediculus humanus corporis]|uniref:Major facilitator superfamily (MFS) profile domain-containing protein n=1 Tax=Pediculus humanus subsp. corporis TaxID=121224 RepID=E0W1D7_PEDHC|nr:uncharacterized protein Phum_PHUM575150 [Pediculus humanus corporis]EEB19443.1 conserved hypothetical protein [Pediculus humanus corporis]
MMMATIIKTFYLNYYYYYCVLLSWLLLFVIFFFFFFRSQGDICVVESKIPLVENGLAAKPIKQDASVGFLSKSERGSAFRQVFAAFAANIGTVNTGLVFGFSAVVLPQLQSSNSTIPINEEQASWVASLSSISTPIGCILGGYLMDLIGRRMTLIVTEFPLIIGWLLIFSANSVYMIYGGRLLVGFGSGMVGAPARVYTGEVTQPHLRGMLLALSSVGVSMGVLIEYLLGHFLTWHILAGISACVPVLALVLLFFLPETPNYLVSQNKTEDSRKALIKLRGSTCNVDAELKILTDFSKKNNVKKIKGFKALTSPTALKPFAILVTYFMFYQFSGVNTITFYAVEVFQQSGAQVNKYLATVILGLVRVIFTVVACISLRKCGRRPLTMISGVGCSLTMFGLGTYMYYLNNCELAGETPQNTWIPVACIFLFAIACTLGFLVVPWVMIGELFPIQVRGIFGGMTTCCAHLFVFIVVKTYPFLYHLIDRFGCFWLYGSVSLVGCIFFYFCVPETKGKTLQEIEDHFAGRGNALSRKRESVNQSLI